MLDKILFYLQYAWSNIYLKGVILYAFYVIFLYFIFIPVFKYLSIKLIKRTKTNLDNEIYGKTKGYVKLLFFLFGLNIVYSLYFANILDSRFVIFYNLLLTSEIILLYIVFHKVAKILLKYFVKKFSETFSQNLSNLIKIILDIFVISVFTLLVLKIWGINITPLLASAGIFGLALAMASKSIIENFLSGMILFADKTINVGDTIILDDNTTAVVEEINIRTTRLRTFDGNIVIIPNSELLNQKIVNKSLSELSPYKRVVVNVGISYGDDVDKAKELIKSYLLELEGIDETTLVVYVDTLADWSVNITGKIMVEADKWSYLLEKQILEKVYKQFPQHNLNFPFPTYQITGKLEK